MLTQPDVIKGMVEMLVSAFDDPEVQKGLSGLIEACLHKALLDKETVDKFRIFVYNLMAMELEDSKGRKSSLLELMLNKATARKSSTESGIQALIEKKQLQVKEKPLDTQPPDVPLSMPKDKLPADAPPNDSKKML